MKKRHFLTIPVLFISGIYAIHVSAQNSTTLLPFPHKIKDMQNALKIQNIKASKDEIKNLQTKILENAYKNVALLKENLVDIISREEVSRIQASVIQKLSINGKDVSIENLGKTPLLIVDNVGNEYTSINMISDYRIIFLPEETHMTTVKCGDVAKMMDLSTPRYLSEERIKLSEKFGSLSLASDNYPNWDFVANGFNEYLIIFDKRYEKCFDYKLQGVAKIKERDALVLEIKGKDRISGKITGTFRKGADYNYKYNGYALIDVETLEIFQLNGGRIDLQSADGESTSAFFSQYEYDKVKIKDQSMMLPVVRNIVIFDIITRSVNDIGEQYDRLSTIYNYRYSDYKAFNVDTTIKFSAPDDFE